MSPEKQRIKIAEACGWRPDEANVGPAHQKVRGWWHNGLFKVESKIPDYLNDLNAMHEAEKTLTHEEKTDYIRILNRGDFSYRRLAFATSKQRAEAFLITIFQWERE